MKPNLLAAALSHAQLPTAPGAELKLVFAAAMDSLDTLEMSVRGAR